MGDQDQLNDKAKELLGDDLENCSLPAFSLTVQKLSHVTSSDAQSMAELSEIILNDPAMSTRVLRASNSAYRVRRGRSNTVSRAVVMLGVDEVKRICLGSALVDGLMQNGESTNENLVNEMARAFHAATQARMIAVQKGERNTEEVFIAALMQSLGPLIYWSQKTNDTEQQFNQLNPEDKPPESAEKELLGLELTELSKILTDKWNLQSLLPSEDSDNPETQQKATKVRLCSKLARRAHLGWDSVHVKELVTDMENQIGMANDELNILLSAAAKEAATTAHFFGVPQVAEALIDLEAELSGNDPMELPPLPEALEESNQTEVNENIANQSADFKGFEANSDVQLKYLREISHLILSEESIEVIMSKILEGLHYGVGLDRIVFAKVDENTNCLKAHQSAGCVTKDIEKGFNFPIAENDFLITLGQSQVPLWAADEKLEKVPYKIKKVINGGEFFVAPLLAHGKWLGAIYADRKPSLRNLDAHMFSAFGQFIMQGSFAHSSLKPEE